MIQIRKATLNDLETLLEFEQGVIASEITFTCAIFGEYNDYFLVIL